jgi:hypothetical protein
MRYLIFLLSFSLSAKTLVRVDDQGMVLEIFDSKGIEKKFHPDLIASLKEAPSDVKQGDYVKDKVKLSKRPSKKHILDENNNWYLPQEYLDAEIKENARNAKLVEIKAMMKDATLTNAELKKVIKLLLIYNGMIEE